MMFNCLFVMTDFVQLSNMQSNLMVREDLKKGVYIEGLTEEIAKSSDETI